MDAVPEKRLDVLRHLFRSLPYGSLRSLEMALGLTHDPKMAEVRNLITAEMAFRHIRDMIFEPFLPLFKPREDNLSLQMFDPRLLENLWQALAIGQPEMVDEAKQCLHTLRTEDATPIVFFRLTKAAADLCRAPTQNLLGPDADETTRFDYLELAHFLDLHQLSVQVLRRLGDYTGRIDAEKAAALRLWFHDASAFDPASGTRFFEIIYANLDDGAQIIKFVAIVSDRPNDRFLAASELAIFGNRILDRIEAQLNRLKTLSTGRICDYPDDLSQLVMQPLNQLQAFGQYIELSREGQWGMRVAKARKIIAERVEYLLNKAEMTLNEALPIYTETGIGRIRKDRPDIAQPASEDIAARALRMCRFTHNVRNIASNGGFATLHTKIAHMLETKLDTTFNELLDMAHDNEKSEGAPLFDNGQLTAACERIVTLMEALCDHNKAGMARRRIHATQAAPGRKGAA